MKENILQLCQGENTTCCAVLALLCTKRNTLASAAAPAEVATTKSSIVFVYEKDGMRVLFVHYAHLVGQLLASLIKKCTIVEVEEEDPFH